MKAYEKRIAELKRMLEQKEVETALLKSFYGADFGEEAGVSGETSG